MLHLVIAVFLPLGIIFIAWLVLKDYRTLQYANKSAFLLRVSGFLFTVIGSCGLLSLESVIVNFKGINSVGGVLGHWVAKGFYDALNLQGASLLLLAISLVGVTWLTGFSWLKLSELIGFYTVVAYRWIINLLKVAKLYLVKKIKLFMTINKPNQFLQPDRRINLDLKKVAEKKKE